MVAIQIPTAIRLAVLTATGVGLATAGALVWFSRKWVRAPRVRFSPPAREVARQVRFAAVDGVALRGLLLPGRPERPALVICHGYQRSMEESFGIGVELHQRGFTVLLFDFRGCGRSGGRFTTIGATEHRDLLGAAAFLRRVTGRDSVGVLGISMGGAVAIRGAARDLRIGAVATDAAFAHLSGAVDHRFAPLRRPMRWVYQASLLTAERLCGQRVATVRPVDEVRHLGRRPILLIHGDQDGIVPHAHLAELHENTDGSAEIWSLPGVRHAAARFAEPDSYVDRLERFFTAALTLPAPAKPVAAVVA